jgi:hypothetical protein
VAELRAEPRFPAVAQAKGHYESFYIRACHPTEPLGVWIRYTVHKRPGAAPRGSTWFVLFDAAAEAPIVSKFTTDDVDAPGGHYIRIGTSTFRPDVAEGEALSDQAHPRWRIVVESDEQPWPYLPADWMYRAPVPRTKAESPYPAARFEGEIELDLPQGGHRHVEIVGWRGMVGHNWGAEHAERWIWTQGLLFDGAENAWFDATLGRIKIGPLTTPWVANAVVALDGELHRLGGPGRRTEVRERPDGAEFTIGGKGLKVRGRVGAERKDFVGWVYADPDGPEHNTVNCSIAEMTLTVERSGGAPVELHTPHGAAYELGMRETDHGIPIQPFPDG